MASRTTPFDIQSVPGYPDALQLYRIPASRLWQVRIFIDRKYVRKSTGTDDKKLALLFAKTLYDTIRINQRLDISIHTDTFHACAQHLMRRQESLVATRQRDQRIVSVAGDFELGLAAAQKGDFATALKLWKPLAHQGDALAQFNLGQMYYNGDGVAKDYAEAVNWFRKAAEQGIAMAQNSLGSMYDNGNGVANDYAEAVKWFRKAADQGDAIAQNNLGSMYSNGKGVAKDYAEAVTWYLRAAEQGHVRGQVNLGMMYVDGRGVDKDYAEAVKWYREAAEQGDVLAQFNLGLMFYKGNGVARNVINAYVLFNISASGGHEKAREVMAILSVDMTKTEIGEAQKKSAEIIKMIKKPQHSVPV